MDHGFFSTSAGRLDRRARVLFAAFRLILLRFTASSSSVSADEGGPEGSGLVPVVAELAGGAVETFAPVAPPTAAIPLVGVPLFRVAAVS